MVASAWVRLFGLLPPSVRVEAEFTVLTVIMCVVAFHLARARFHMVLGVPFAALALLPSTHVGEISFIPLGEELTFCREGFGPCRALFGVFSPKVIVGAHVVVVVVVVVVVG